MRVIFNLMVLCAPFSGNIIMGFYNGMTFAEYELQSSIDAVALLRANTLTTSEDQERGRRTVRFLDQKIKALQDGRDWRGLRW